MIYRFKKNKTSNIIFVLAILLFLFVYLFLPPKNFIEPKTLTIEKGASITEVSKSLRSEELIRSPFIFNLLIMSQRSHVVAGKYVFKEPVNIFNIVKRISKGEYGIDTIQITFFEGVTVSEMAELLEKNLDNFDKEKFLEIALPKEGYLFPDTYKFVKNQTPEEVLEILEENFEKQINNIEINEKIKNSKYTLEQIIIMASIIEKEATSNTRQEISNILWKRFEEGMLLQVDAPFVYSIGRGTFDLTLDDLDSDDPYNTYKFLGLVPTPISNPGLDSILAAATPQETEYYYFLTGQDGKMYYAHNFEEHKKNRRNYLD